LKIINRRLARSTLSSSPRPSLCPSWQCIRFRPQSFFPKTQPAPTADSIPGLPPPSHLKAPCPANRLSKASRKLFLPPDTIELRQMIPIFRHHPPPLPFLTPLRLLPTASQTPPNASRNSNPRRVPIRDQATPYLPRSPLFLPSPLRPQKHSANPNPLYLLSAKPYTFSAAHSFF